MIGPTYAALAVAFALCLVLIPAMRALAHRHGWIDTPGTGSAHREPTALLGGVGVILAVALAMASVAPPATTPLMTGLYGGVALLALVGLWDDRHPLPPLLKLLATGIVALILVIAGAQWVAIGGGASIAVTLLWLVAIPHAVNLLDHLDGVAAGVAGVAAAVLAIGATSAGSPHTAALAAALAGACGAFLFFNRPPATIFLGDAGSLPIGLVLAVLSLEVIPVTADMAAAASIPPLILLVAVCDTSLVTSVRLWRGDNPMAAAATDHVGHRLRARFGHNAALVILYATAAAGGALALWMIGRAAG